MSSPRRRLPANRFALLAAAAGILIALSGCTDSGTGDGAAGPTGGASQTSTGAPTGSATPAPTATPASYAPLPRMDFDCTDIAWDPALSSILEKKVAPAQPAGTWLAATAEIPYSYVVQTLGGLVCEWSNGQPRASVTGSTPDYVGAQVSILPESEAQWAEYATTYGFTGNEYSGCTVDEIRSCHAEQLVDGFWVQVDVGGLAASGAGSEAAALTTITPFVNAVVASVESSTSPGPRWTPPAGTIGLPADPATQCEQFIPHTALQGALAATVDLAVTRPAGGYSQKAAAEDQLFTAPCLWLLPNADVMVGELAWLPGGEWAARDAMTLATLPSEPEEIAVDSLQEGDSAWIRCTVGDSDCFLDLVVGGNWVQVRVLQDATAAAGAITADHRAGAVAVAAQVIANLRAA